MHVEEKEVKIDDVVAPLKLRHQSSAIAESSASDARQFSVNPLKLSTVAISNFVHELASEMNELMYIKSIYLNLLRGSYYRQIDCGKLSRAGTATKALLYSVDNALDRLHKKGLRDWKCMIIFNYLRGLILLTYLLNF